MLVWSMRAGGAGRFRWGWRPPRASRRCTWDSCAWPCRRSAAGAVALCVRSWRSAGAEGADGVADHVRRSGLVAPTSSRSVSLAVLWAPRSWTCSCTTRATSEVVDWFGHSEGEGQTLGPGLRTIDRAVRPRRRVARRQGDAVAGRRVAISLLTPRPWLLVPVVAVAAALWRGRGPGRRLVVTLAGAFALSVIAVVRTVGQAFDYRLRWTWMVAVLVAAASGWAGLRGGRRPLGARSSACCAGRSASSSSAISASTHGRRHGGHAAGRRHRRARGPDAGGPRGGGRGRRIGARDRQVRDRRPGTGGASCSSSSAAAIDARVPADQEQVFGDRRVGRDEADVTLVVAQNEAIERWNATRRCASSPPGGARRAEELAQAAAREARDRRRPGRRPDHVRGTRRPELADRPRRSPTTPRRWPTGSRCSRSTAGPDQGRSTGCRRAVTPPAGRGRGGRAGRPCRRGRRVGPPPPPSSR